MLHRSDHRATAMAVQFGQIFTGRRLRSGEPQQQRMVQHLALTITQRS
jgi:hypothetical protein